MFLDLIIDIFQTVLRYLRWDWPILAIGILVAVVTKVYFGDALKNRMQKNSGVSVLGSIGFGAFTPFCACGTMAVLLSMFVTSLPWGAVMAFLITSPLTSPTQFIFQSGFLGIRLATAGLISALTMGLLAGILAIYLDKTTNFFKGQYRLAPSQCGATCAASKLCCGAAATKTWAQRLRLDQVVRQAYELGIKRVMMYFMIFIALGRLVEIFIPTQAILMLFDPNKIYSVPLAALIGLPLYVSGSAGLPLLESFLRAGAGEGAVLAFLIAGQGTSVGVMLGISTFLKPKAITFYVTCILTGGILAGFIYEAITKLL